MGFIYLLFVFFLFNAFERMLNFRCLEWKLIFLTNSLKKHKDEHLGPENRPINSFSNVWKRFFCCLLAHWQFSKHLCNTGKRNCATLDLNLILFNLNKTLAKSTLRTDFMLYSFQVYFFLLPTQFCTKQ